MNPISSIDNHQVSIETFGITDRGQVRKDNEDQFLIADLHKGLRVDQASFDQERNKQSGDSMGKLLVVADGIAGTPAGEVASQMAIREVVRFLLNSMHWLLHPNEPEIEQFVQDLGAAAFQSHQTIRLEGETNEDRFGMGTTLTVAYVLWPMLYVLHVGDTRCYVMHNGHLLRVTTDQTIAQYLVEEGVLDNDSFAHSPFKNVLWSAIGGETDPKAIVYRQRLEPGDRLLLCSDGVTNYWSDPDLKQLLIGGENPQQICHQLVDTANQLGGTDNITAIVASFLPRGEDD